MGSCLPHRRRSRRSSSAGREAGSQGQQRDIDGLLGEIVGRTGDFVEKIETVYAWSAARLDEVGRAAWKALVLFPAGCAPELLLRDAAGSDGLKALREAALADFHSAEQVWRWHATVSEYASCYWPLSDEKRRSLTIDLLPAWAKWIEKLPAEGGTTLSQLETNLPNLEASLDACIKANQEIADAFLKALDSRLPSPDRTLALRELNAEVCRIQLSVLPPDENARRAGLLNNLGNALFALGQREDALEAAKEASNVYRQLAKKNPDAFLPNLATSLGALGRVLQSLDRDDEAAGAFHEGLQSIAPFFKALPQAFAGLVGALFKDYLQACEKAGQEPDMELLNQFANLESSSGSSQ